MDRLELKSILEALLFASAEPLSPAELKKLIKIKKPEEVLQEKAASDEAGIEQTPELTDKAEESDVDPLAQLLQKKSELDDEISTGEIRQILDSLVESYQSNESCGYELVEVAKGYQFRTRAKYADYVRNMFKSPKPRFSQPSLETLSIIAYQQPVMKFKVDEIRGVESGGVIKTLIDRDLVRVVGRSEDPGKPVLYGTTRKFLEVFGLASLGDLPTLRDLASLETVQVVNEDGLDLEVSSENSETDVNNFQREESYLTLDDDSADQLIAELDTSLDNLKQTEKKVFDTQTNNPDPDHVA